MSALDYGEQIAQVRDRIREERRKAKESADRFKARVAALEERLDNLCDLQLGRTGAQGELPGSDAARVLSEGRRGDG